MSFAGANLLALFLRSGVRDTSVKDEFNKIAEKIIVNDKNRITNPFGDNVVFSLFFLISTVTLPLRRISLFGVYPKIT
jgi:hypothetical protein